MLPTSMLYGTCARQASKYLWETPLSHYESVISVALERLGFSQCFVRGDADVSCIDCKRIYCGMRCSRI